MTAMPHIGLRETQKPKGGDVLLSEDWVSPEGDDPALRNSRNKRGLVSLNRSPLARKIIIFNLMALLVLVAGVLFLNPFRDSLVIQREQAFVTEAQLVADIFESRLPAEGIVDMGEDSVFARSIGDISLSAGTSIYVIDKDGRVVGNATGAIRGQEGAVSGQSTLITDFLNSVWENSSKLFSSGRGRGAVVDPESLARALFQRAMSGETVINLGKGAEGGALFSVVSPVERAGEVLAVVALISAEGEIDALVRNEREQILQMFLLALLVSIGLSLVLASTIANPLSDLAAAAELGHDRDARKMQPGRIRIPDLAGRPDEIGRLSVAVRGMVAALYDRIDANEQFAADVAHEIKNPLASLRSAVASLHMAKRDDQRTRLLEVIDHDVRRLDRLVSDISNASRLDSELVKEEEEQFNLTKTLTNLCEYLGQQAGEKGVELITDFPTTPIMISGLEARLAQVFVNLITNAVSFCEDGDAVRVWMRERDNRVLVVVEDTGPGIPEEALTKVFKRFYSERPQGQFGNNSGLGLSISKQIVEAHGGVIWAENIRPTHADATSDPLGARFIVGLPV
ncbi:MAG: sensor histidine kinase [Pseudotabrizicola sp.]|uniref:sensor histidine kinase n=1 Tax=Pseudotabrizicola sp. TaxID=2939647 RepID=UPI00271F2B82|nr:sensor histidine kinase [Pseudotabrizicola sp.]MDO8883413.1 sensor histidine kinase [Pseudotabrizicola sp.]MDP2082345.1 sensor histidine kinase [Pseudotabrizicola sp.]MDZ7574328.1 sensor histidine kinase [Pseudotabrizicola sp.]